MLLDPDDRLLLFEAHAPGVPERKFWIAPGGGIEQGEDARAAVLRELWEEVGASEAFVGPLVWHRRHPHIWDGRAVDQHEQFFFTRTPHFEPRTVAMGAEEAQYLLRFRWWTLTELLDPPGETTFAPRRLGPLLRDLLERGAPEEPIDSGV